MTILLIITETGLRIITMPDMQTCVFVALQVEHMGRVMCGMAGVAV
jgi:hypothetical protein